MKFFPTLTASVIIATLGVQADNLCRVASRAECRSKASATEGHFVRNIETNELFGARCTAAGDGYIEKLGMVASKRPLTNSRTWDLIPGWNCLVSVGVTRSVDCSHASCECKFSSTSFCRKNANIRQ